MPFISAVSLELLSTAIDTPATRGTVWRLTYAFIVGSLPFSLLIWHTDVRTTSLVIFVLVQYGGIY
jgi:hypothetical protein